jgi:hypothetical protein
MDIFGCPEKCPKKTPPEGNGFGVSAPYNPYKITNITI